MKVLFATDGSAASGAGEALIATLFEPMKVFVDVFSVNPRVVEELPMPESMWASGKHSLPMNADRIADEAADRLWKSGFVPHFRSGEGNPPAVIERSLREGHYDLVVLGASHTSWMGNALMGSVSTHVLHHSPCSVLIAHESPRKAAAKVVFATDGSDAARHGLDIAMHVLDPSRCSLLITTVVTPWPFARTLPPEPLLAGYVNYLDEEQPRIDQAWQLIARYKAEVEKEGFDVEGSVLLGSAAPQILKEAESADCALVVMGARGLGAIKRTLLGSVSDSVVRHAPATLVGRALG